MVVHAVILAAGDSSRMGRAKALLPFRQSNFVGEALSVFSEVKIDTISVVAGKHYNSLRGFLAKKEVNLLHNPDPARGQLSSLQIALKQPFAASSDVIVMWLIDHPGVQPETLKTLLKAFSSNCDFLKPRFKGRGGHPLLINARMIARILDLPLENGLKPLLRNPDIIVCNQIVTDPAVLQDIDTKEDYKELIT
jgi:molybdenum cofactor cytidylyltransferase